MPQSPLYTLVWNLSAGEKKMVRKILAANKQKRPSNFLKVFELIDKHGKGENKAIDKKLQSDPSIKNLAATKHQLYHHVLDCVAGTTEKFDAKYYQRATKIDYLISKAMYKEGLKLIDSLKQEAAQHERHHFLADLHYNELTALRGQGELQKCHSLARSWQSDKSRAMEQRRKYDDAYNNYYKLYLEYCTRGAANTPQDRERYQSFINESFMNRDRYSEADGDSYGSSYFYHTLALLVANLALNKFNQSVQHSGKLLDIISRDTQNAIHDAQQYAMILYNHGLGSYFSGREHEIDNMINGINSIEWFSVPGEEGFYELFYEYMLTYMKQNPSIQVDQFRSTEQKVSRRLERLLKESHPIKRRQIISDVQHLLNH